MAWSTAPAFTPKRRRPPLEAEDVAPTRAAYALLANDLGTRAAKKQLPYFEQFRGIFERTDENGFESLADFARYLQLIGTIVGEGEDLTTELYFLGTPEDGGPKALLDLRTAIEDELSDLNGIDPEEIGRSAVISRQVIRGWFNQIKRSMVLFKRAAVAAADYGIDACGFAGVGGPSLTDDNPSAKPESDDALYIREADELCEQASNGTAAVATVINTVNDAAFGQFLTQDEYPKYARMVEETGAAQAQLTIALRALDTPPDGGALDYLALRDELQERYAEIAPILVAASNFEVPSDHNTPEGEAAYDETSDRWEAFRWELADLAARTAAAADAYRLSGLLTHQAPDRRWQARGPPSNPCPQAYTGKECVCQLRKGICV